jgi:hypothetical protein
VSGAPGAHKSRFVRALSPVPRRRACGADLDAARARLRRRALVAINWVRGPDKMQRRVPPLAWLAFLMVAFPLGLYPCTCRRTSCCALFDGAG